MSPQLTRTAENAAEIEAVSTACAPYGGGRVGQRAPRAALGFAMERSTLSP